MCVMIFLTNFIFYSTASDLAFQEYEKLKGSYEKEILCRDQAEKYASTVRFLF